MEKYEAVPIKTKEITVEFIPEILNEFAPTLAGMLCGRRLIRHVNTNFYHWEARWGSPSSPWQTYSHLIQLKRVGHASDTTEESGLTETGKACVQTTEDILEKLDALRLKAMDKKTPVTPINDCIYQVRIVQGALFDPEQ